MRAQMKTDIYCCKIQVDQLNVYLASTRKGAFRIGLSLGKEIDATDYFQKRLPEKNIIEDADTNRPLANAVKAALMNRAMHDSLSLDIQAGPFQMMTWKAIARIPFGETKTYGEVARMIERPNSARAVGQAMRRNPLPLVFP
jgi:O6-methylguanine-DNA--protein-cysteine methyltransferase